MTTRLLLVVLIAICATGCSISKTVDPVKAAAVSKICILDNPKVLMAGFQPEVVRQLQSMNFPTRSYTGARPAECSHHLEYTANWAWDMAMYLTFAEFRVYDARGVAGTATYDARNGGGRLDKFGTTAEKIRPLLTQLFASASVGAVVPAAEDSTAADAALAAGDASREERLTELLQLKDKGLITAEEYAAKRQAILNEI